MTFRLADAIFWVAVACFAVGQSAILRSIIGSPARVTHAGGAPARRTTEIVWAILPAVALTVVMLLTWRAMHSTTTARAGRTALGEAIVAGSAR